MAVKERSKKLSRDNLEQSLGPPCGCLARKARALLVKSE